MFSDAPSGIFVLFSFLPIIIYLVLIVLGILFVVKVIKFMNEKTILDRERNEKLDELLKAVRKNNEI
ncbi:hypothetical protein BIV60_02025 [Bacillus sp. MUM 116]|uniref:hypothetical protein n=1 Tax=Bacillus sp. MUM 116 TaxID=1678002 RepID=UPI0008F5A77B|nr:hypothetical protein [Bacillus sp. MUM 116]OIK16817.1 hypothetical protein BIV60_02025 [Bacillus sp. MUM 116]